MNLQALSLTSVECPKCGKHSIVGTADGTYECLNCDFRKSFKSEGKQSGTSDKAPSHGGENAFSTAIGVLGFLFILFLFA